MPGPGSFRSAHGNARKGRKSTVFEAVPDGLRPANAPLAEPIETDSAGRFTSAGARVAARRRHELAKIPDYCQRELDYTATESFNPFDVARRELLAARIAELVQRYGFVSPGVATVLRGWSWLVAFAEHAAVDAAQTGDCDAQDRARRLFKDASIELSKAWELARVEAETRKNDGPSVVEQLQAEAKVIEAANAGGK